MTVIKALFYITFLIHCHILLCQSHHIPKLGSETNLFDVTKFGVVGDGAHDDSEAFNAAWDAKCSGHETPTMYVPVGKTFLLRSVGSLGRNGKYETVEHVHVRDVTFSATTHGARV